MTHLLSAALALVALLVRHFLCGHPARTTRPSGLWAPSGEQLVDVHCPTCKTAWVEYQKNNTAC